MALSLGGRPLSRQFAGRRLRLSFAAMGRSLRGGASCYRNPDRRRPGRQESDVMETPVSLLERLREPAQEQAWARFVELYTPLLFHWARHIGLQEADAADLVQDVLADL